MLTVLLVVQAIVALAMIILILMQHTSADGLSGLSGGSGGGNSLLSGRASSNLQSRTTAILAVIFMANSLLMATVTARDFKSTGSVAERIAAEENAAPQKREVEIPGDEDIQNTDIETGGTPSAPIAE